MQTPEDMGVWRETAPNGTRDVRLLARHSDPDLTLNTCAHTRLEDLASVVDNLPTSKLWASDPLCDLARILPTGGVSAGLNGTVGNQPEMRPRSVPPSP